MKVVYSINGEDLFNETQDEMPLYIQKYVWGLINETTKKVAESNYNEITYHLQLVEESVEAARSVLKGYKKENGSDSSATHSVRVNSKGKVFYTYTDVCTITSSGDIKIHYESSGNKKENIAKAYLNAIKYLIGVETFTLHPANAVELINNFTKSDIEDLVP